MTNLNEQIVCLICARGGSKGVPKKNIRSFFGKPLIAHTIELAQSIDKISEVIVSTDDEEIAKVSKQYGATDLCWVQRKSLKHLNNSRIS